MESLGVSLYLDADFTVAHRRPFLGFIGAPVIRDISNLAVRQFDYDLSIFQHIEDPSPGWWLYSPRTFAQATDAFVSRMSNVNISGLSMSTLSRSPYGDVGRRHMDRGAAEILLSDIARDTSLKMGGLMGDAAGAFWLPHSSVVLNSPLGCSGFTITDKTVPFYQMVLHGYVEFSLPAFNLAADHDGQVLRAAETGALLQLSVIAENPALLVETPLEWLFSPSFDYWHGFILDAVHRLTPVYTAVAGSTISSHSFLDDGVAETVFSNGARVLVNYNRAQFYHGNITIPARDFVVLPGGAS